jgi:hypothetical protein
MTVTWWIDGRLVPADQVAAPADEDALRRGRAGAVAAAFAGMIGAETDP